MSNVATTKIATRITAVVFAAGILAACNSNSMTDRALIGTAVGAGAGAVIGAQVGNPIAGAAVGGVAGAAVGAATTPGQ